MAVQVKIQADKFRRLGAAVRKELRDETLALATELEGRIKLNLRDVGAINTTALVGSYAVSEGAKGEIRVGTPLEYGDYIEFGTRPHWAPLEPLMRWVETKLNVIAVGVTFKSGKAAPTGKAKRQFSSIRNVDRRRAAIMRVARLVQFKIAHHGMSPRHAVRNALDAMGLEYRLRNYVYQIDTVKALAKNPTLWAKIRRRLS